MWWNTKVEMAEGIEVGLRLASRMHGGDLNEVSVENVCRRIL